MNNILIIAISLAVVTTILIFPFILYSGKSIMLVTSYSMLPTLKPYDMIVVEKVGIDKVRMGDIIAFNSHLEDIPIIAHRVVEVYNQSGEILITTKGDNEEEVDEWPVNEDSLIGKVVAIVPSMGVLLYEPIRYGIVAIIAIMLIILMYEVKVRPKVGKTSS